MYVDAGLVYLDIKKMFVKSLRVTVTNDTLDVVVCHVGVFFLESFSKGDFGPAAVCDGCSVTVMSDATLVGCFLFKKAHS